MNLFDQFKHRRGDRVYILPTRYGFLFIAATVAMTLAGSAYQNNLVNIVAYFMLSATFAAAISTHNNVKNISVASVDAENAFAGGEIVVTTTLVNSGSEARYNLEARLRRMTLKSVYDPNPGLAARGVLKSQATYLAPRRGLYKTKGTRVSSVFPLGLFEAWKVIDSELTYLVYPRLNGSRHWPGRANHGSEPLGSIPNRGDDFHGHRAYRPGDPHRHIDWKAVARGRPPMVKEFNEGAPAVHVFDWADLASLGYEQRLEQLALWIDEAHGRKLTFSLKLPGQEIPQGSGPAHARRCWRALAEFPAEGA